MAKLKIRDPITTIKEIGEIIPTIAHNIKTEDTDLLDHIGQEIKNELALNLDKHNKFAGSSEEHYPGLSSEKIEEIVETIPNKIYKASYKSYISAKNSFMKEDYEQTIKKLISLIKPIKLLKKSKVLYNEQLRRLISESYLLTAFSNWNLGKYHDSFIEIRFSIFEIRFSIFENSDFKRDLEKLEGEMWHAWIRNHIGEVSQNDRYLNYLNSSLWKEKRKARKKIDGNLCICGKVLPVNHEIHHKTYERVGMEKSSDLICLCKNCHKLLHDYNPYNHTWPTYVDDPLNLVRRFSYNAFIQITENSTSEPQCSSNTDTIQ